MFYVALTRAEKTATLSYAETRRHWGKFTNCSPSRFISEIDSNYLDLSEMSGNFIAKQAFIKNSEEARFASFKKEIPLANFKKVQTTASSEVFESSNSGDLKQGMTVEHATFGMGTIAEIEKDRVVISFVNFGAKTLLMKFAKLKIING